MKNNEFWYFAISTTYEKPRINYDPIYLLNVQGTFLISLPTPEI